MPVASSHVLVLVPVCESEVPGSEVPALNLIDVCPACTVIDFGIDEAAPAAHFVRLLICYAEPAFLQSIVEKGERLRSGLAEALKGNEHVKEIRGLGLITGIQLDQVQYTLRHS